MQPQITRPDVIWFCQCNVIPPGGYCPKHGTPTEEDRLRRRESTAACERLRLRALKLGSWKLLEDLLPKE